MHDNGRNRYLLVLGEETTQVLDNATLSLEPKYHINFTEPEKRYVVSLLSNWSNSFLFASEVKCINLKQNIQKEKPHPLCVGNVSSDFTFDNINKKRLK